jgi:hypothetical protein
MRFPIISLDTSILPVSRYPSPGSAKQPGDSRDFVEERVLVSGATGGVGQLVVSKLLSEGFNEFAEFPIRLAVGMDSGKN